MSNSTLFPIPAYSRSAYLYDSYIPQADYAEGARRLIARIRSVNPGAQTLLDVGSGSGKYLEHLQHDFVCEGLDLSDGFIEIARARCPEVPIHKGNMVDFDLGHRFDAISCLFLAIAYTGSLENMERAIASMARHLEPGGVLLIEPWVYPENFWERRVTVENIREDDMHLCRMFVARREGALSVYDIHYLVGTPDGVEHFIEREELALFTHEEYLGAFRKAGLEVFHDPKAGLFDAHNIGLYWGIRH